MTPPTDRTVQASKARVAYRRDIRRGRIVIAGALALTGVVAAILVWFVPTLRNCDYAMFDPALKGKSYVCPDPAPEMALDPG